MAFETKYGVTVAHAWGMTEMSPLGSFCSIKPDYGDIRGDALFDLKMKQGHPPFSVEFRITDDAGRDLPWDAKTFGRLKVRGPAVARPISAGTRRSSTSTASSTPGTWRRSTRTA